MTQQLSAGSVVRIELPTPFPVGPVNVFLVKGDALTLVDTGARSDEAYERLSLALGGYGLRISDLQVILITHGHLDHMGLLPRLLEESSAEAYAHPLVLERSLHYEVSERANREFYRSILQEFGTPPEALATFAKEAERLAPWGQPVRIQHPVADGERIGPYSALYVPGHSSSDTLFVDPRAKSAFTGDHLLKGIKPNPLIRRPPAGQPRAKSLLEFLSSLQRTRSLDLDICYPGHGEPITDHREVVDDLVLRIQERTERVFNLLQPGDALTPYQVAAALFPRLDTKLLMLGISVAVGHLEVLEQENRVRSERRGEILYFGKPA